MNSNPNLFLVEEEVTQKAMELQELYNRLVAEGCNHFFIKGLGGPIPDDVECLDYQNGVWEIYYTERGQKSAPIFSTANKQEAIQFYYDHILKMDHWHLVLFTRLKEKLSDFKSKLEKSEVPIIQNDIPDYAFTGDRVYRLFVINKDIFKAQQLFETLPSYDPDFIKFHLEFGRDSGE